MAIVIVDNCVLRRINEYYNNVEIKYPNNNTINKLIKLGNNIVVDPN